MCLAIPGVVISIDGETAFVDYGGIQREAEATFFPHLRVGDCVLVHAGFVIQILSAEDGKELSELAREVWL